MANRFYIVSEKNIIVCVWIARCEGCSGPFHWELKWGQCTHLKLVYSPTFFICGKMWMHEPKRNNSGFTVMNGPVSLTIRLICSACVLYIVINWTRLTCRLTSNVFCWVSSSSDCAVKSLNTWVCKLCLKTCRLKQLNSRNSCGGGGSPLTLLQSFLRNSRAWGWSCSTDCDTSMM